MRTPATFGESYTHYFSRANLKSPHTMAAYRRAIDLFFDFLSDRHHQPLLPIQQLSVTLPQEIPLAALTDDDKRILLHFAEWLLSPGTDRDKRPYSLATVELRLAGVINWFQYMDDQGWLPGNFWLYQAIRLVRERLKTDQQQKERTVSPPQDLEPVIYYYDHQEMPGSLRKAKVDPARIEQWEVKRLRNRALLHCLAETGGRVSEILSLNTDIFGTSVTPVLEVKVRGKGGHTYTLRLAQSLPPLRDYLRKRDALVDILPLFVSHDPRYTGNRMSRIVAWRVVHRAAKAMGMPDVSPQDFRHWRAVQLLQAGHTLEEVQEILGHRSLETVKAFYAHLEEDE